MKRLYDSRAWRTARANFLTEHPLCVMCKAAGRTVPAAMVDHVTPHKGDEELFWDEGNWQPLCTVHHNSSKQRQEKRGHLVGCDASGAPLDPNSHWHKRGGAG